MTTEGEKLREIKVCHDRVKTDDDEYGTETRMTEGRKSDEGMNRLDGEKVPDGHRIIATQLGRKENVAGPKEMIRVLLVAGEVNADCGRATSKRQFWIIHFVVP
jgi:hypothetical protein